MRSGGGVAGEAVALMGADSGVDVMRELLPEALPSIVRLLDLPALERAAARADTTVPALFLDLGHHAVAQLMYEGAVRRL